MGGQSEGERLAADRHWVRALLWYRRALKAEHDPLALAQMHYEVAEVYRSLAGRSFFLSGIFSRKACHHLRSSIRYEGAPSAAYFLLAGHAHEARDLLGALDLIEKAVTIHRRIFDYLDKRQETYDRDARASLASMLGVAASYHREAGVLDRALGYVAQGIEEFELLPAASREQWHAVWSTLQIEAYLIFAAEMNFPAAAGFLRSTQSDIFLAKHNPELSKTFRSLEPAYKAIAQLAQDPNARPPETLATFQRRYSLRIAETTTIDGLQELYGEILGAIATNEINQILQKMAEPILTHIRNTIEETGALAKQLEPASHVTANLITEERLQTLPLGFEQKMRELNEFLVNSERSEAKITAAFRQLALATQKLSEINLEVILQTCEQPYRLGFSMRFSWLWLVARKHAIAILISCVGIGLLLPFTLAHVFPGLIGNTALVFASYFLEKPFAQRVEDALLPSFRYHLQFLTQSLCSSIWIHYNGFLRIIAKINDLKD